MFGVQKTVAMGLLCLFGANTCRIPYPLFGLSDVYITELAVWISEAMRDLGVSRICKFVTAKENGGS